MAYKWSNALKLANSIYEIVEKYPQKENFALANQTTRAVVSISANIAEGSSRSSKKDFSHFLEIALGSAFELETLLMIALHRNYVSLEKKTLSSNLLELTVKQVYGLKRRLNCEN